MLREIPCTCVHLFTCTNTVSCGDTCIQCTESTALLGDWFSSASDHSMWQIAGRQPNTEKPTPSHLTCEGDWAKEGRDLTSQQACHHHSSLSFSLPLFFPTFCFSLHLYHSPSFRLAVSVLPFFHHFLLLGPHQYLCKVFCPPSFPLLLGEW